MLLLLLLKNFSIKWLLAVFFSKRENYRYYMHLYPCNAFLSIVPILNCVSITKTAIGIEVTNFYERLDYTNMEKTVLE